MDLSNERELRKITANIIIAARKKRGMTQDDVSRALNIAQSTLSRIEAEKLVPSVFMWLELCQLLDIPLDAILSGYLDKESNVDISSGKLENGFLLPLKYSDVKCIKVRMLAPIMQFIQDKWGVKAYEKMCKYLHVNRSFFVNMDNQVNLRFVEDLLRYLSTNFQFEDSQIKEMAKLASEQKYHGSLAKQYLSASDQLTMLKRYINNAAKYQHVFLIKPETQEKTTLSFTLRPNPQIRPMLTQKLQTFIEQMLDESLRQVATLPFKGGQIRASEVQIQRKEEMDHTLYQLSVL